MFKNTPVKALIDIQDTIGEAQDLLLTLEHIISTPQIPPQEIVMVQTKRTATRLKRMSVKLHNIAYDLEQGDYH